MHIDTRLGQHLVSEPRLEHLVTTNQTTTETSIEPCIETETQNQKQKNPTLELFFRKQ